MPFLVKNIFNGRDGHGSTREPCPSHDLVVQAALKAEHDKPQSPAFDDGLIARRASNESAIKWRRNAEAP